jgi:hypothetical protein
MGASKLEAPISLTYKRERSDFYRIKRSILFRQNQNYRTKFFTS